MFPYEMVISILIKLIINIQLNDGRELTSLLLIKLTNDRSNLVAESTCFNLLQFSSGLNLKSY